MWKRDLFPLCLNSFLMSLVATKQLFVLYICMYVLNMGSNNSLPKKTFLFQFPAAGLAITNIVFIIICLPFVRQFYGFLTRQNIKVYVWGRLWFGLFLASMALLSAGVVEYMRMRNICECGYYRQSIGEYQLVNMCTNTIHIKARQLRRIWAWNL